MSKEIKVTVDYANGCYNVTGLRDGKPYTLSKPIRGEDTDGIYRENFSNMLKQERQRRMRIDIRSLLVIDRGFKFSRKAFKDVDTTMYAALSDWDRANGTNYARRYLRSIVEDYNYGRDKKLSKDEIRSTRKMVLADRGIDITYNVGIFNTDKKMKLIDKLKGIIMAFRQRNSIGANVYSSFRLNDTLYLNDLEEVLEIDDFDDEEVDDQDLREEQTQPQAQPHTQSQSQSKTTYRGDRIYWERPTKAKETEKPKQPGLTPKVDNTKPDKQPEPVVVAPDGKTDPKKRTVKDSAKTIKNSNRVPRRKRIQAQKEKMRSETPQQRNARLTAEKNKRKEQIHKAQEARAEKERREAEAKAKALEEEERRRQEEEKRAEEDRKKFEDADRAVQKIVEDEEKYIEIARAVRKNMETEEAKIRAEQEKEERKRPKTEARKQFKNGKLAKAVAALSGAVLAAKGKFKGIFSDKLKAKKINREDTGFIFDEEGWAESLENSKKMKKAPKEPKDKKKLSLNIKDSLNKTKTGRKINAGVRHYKRKLRSFKDSIKNFKFKPSEKFKKIVIKGAIGVVTVTMLFLAVNGTVKAPNAGAGADLGYTIEETTPGITENSNINIEVTPNGQPGGTESTSPEETKPSETETQNPTVTETQKPGEESPEETKPGETGTQQPGETETQKPGETEVEQPGGGETQQPGETETEQPSGGETQQPGETETEQPTEGETETEKPGETKPGEDETEKTDEEKLEEFRQDATQKYMEEFVIGEKPEVGDMLQDKVYWEKPDGTGKFGYFESHPDYAISHINIIQESGWTVVRADGRSLTELLAEYPDCIDYNVHFVNSKTGGGLGFVTKTQLESMIKDKVDSIIQSKIIQNNPTQNQDNQDIER